MTMFGKPKEHPEWPCPRPLEEGGIYEVVQDGWHHGKVEIFSVPVDPDYLGLFTIKRDGKKRVLSIPRPEISLSCWLWRKCETVSEV
jgi:hypothetical protein